jgi:hypothetical protein
MSGTSTSTTSVTGRLGRGWRPRRPGRRLLAGVGAVLLAIGVVVAVTNPFAGDGASGSSSGTGSSTSLATVARQSLTSQAQVDGTLGYAGSSSIVAPAGTAQSALLQAEQTAATARAALHAAQASLSADERTLAQARAKLAADRLKVMSDCAGAGAAGSSSGNGNGDGNGNGSDSSPCATAAQAVASDAASVATAEQKVVADRGTVASARATLAGAEQSLAAAESSATGLDAAAAYTMLPSAGTVVRRGKALYAVDGQPVLLLYGRLTAWRAFRLGMSPGRDVAELNANLRALGYGSGLGGDSFTAATRAAILRLQAAHGLPQSGALALGSAVFKPGPVRVTSVTPTLGQAVQAGAVLTVSSIRHEVAIKLDAAQQAQVKVGDPVTITLPDNSTTAGRVASVGKVASSSSGSDSGSSTPTIDVSVRLLHQAAAGQLVQAPVSVSITTASVKDALVVPVNALLALAGGGYAIEVVDAAGVHHLVAVTLGLFDDAAGLVQVSGSGVKSGQRVVVPAS